MPTKALTFPGISQAYEDVKGRYVLLPATVQEVRQQLAQQWPQATWKAEPYPPQRSDMVARLQHAYLLHHPQLAAARSKDLKTIAAALRAGALTAGEAHSLRTRREAFEIKEGMFEREDLLPDLDNQAYERLLMEMPTAGGKMRDALRQTDHVSLLAVERFLWSPTPITLVWFGSQDERVTTTRHLLECSSGRGGKICVPWPHSERHYAQEMVQRPGFEVALAKALSRWKALPAPKGEWAEFSPPPKPEGGPHSSQLPAANLQRVPKITLAVEALTLEHDMDTQMVALARGGLLVLADNQVWELQRQAGKWQPKHLDGVGAEVLFTDHEGAWAVSAEQAIWLGDKGHKTIRLPAPQSAERWYSAKAWQMLPRVGLAHLSSDGQVRLLSRTGQASTAQFPALRTPAVATVADTRPRAEYRYSDPQLWFTDEFLAALNPRSLQVSRSMPRTAIAHGMHLGSIPGGWSVIASWNHTLVHDLEGSRQDGGWRGNYQVHLARSAQGRLLASSETFSGVTVWDMRSRTPVAHLPKPEGYNVAASAFSFDGKTLSMWLESVGDRSRAGLMTWPVPDALQDPATPDAVPDGVLTR
ncbi:MAG: hypothetical protein U5L74_14075 [Ideonella sp.]|nr:hypothetical protein [Ideonella sp.]